ncbi:MAG: DUF302 domain-containing protein [Acidobacteria bacterium]|nr:DUF302 domain-containing protein [Acidobacteriota bacterium]
MGVMKSRQVGWSLTLLAVLVLSVATLVAQQIKVSQTIVEKVIDKPYQASVAKIDAAIKAARFMVIGEPNFQMMQRMVGRERRGAKAYFIFRPDLGTPVFDNDYNASMEIPLKILIYEREDKKTVVRYKLPSAALADYKGLSSLGKDLDTALENIVAAASK